MVEVSTEPSTPVSTDDTLLVDSQGEVVSTATLSLTQLAQNIEHFALLQGDSATAEVAAHARKRLIELGTMGIDSACVSPNRRATWNVQGLFDARVNVISRILSNLSRTLVRVERVG